jgi:serine/threonine protein kinase
VDLERYNSILNKVWKAEFKADKSLYAIKEISKVKAYEKESINLIFNERKLLTQLRHPYYFKLNIVS